MYAKTEVFYMMRDKVIPALLNSEKTIKFDDIKEVLDKTSFWKKDTINNNSKLSKYCSPKNSKKFNSNKKQKIEYIPIPLYKLEDSNDSKNFSNIIKRKNLSKKSRNYNLNNLLKTFSDKQVQTTDPGNIFSNPILKSISKNKDNKTIDNSNFYTSSIKTSKYNLKNNIFLHYKNNNRYIKSRNNALSSFKNRMNNYDYKTFYTFKKNKNNVIKLGNNVVKKDEENDHMILRGLAMNKEQKYYYLKCKLTDFNNKNKQESMINIKKDKDKHIEKKQLNNNSIFNNKLKSNNLDFNLAYSLKG
jgi:putative methionine-R-sulfoxide reductase with GAF domain